MIHTDGTPTVAMRESDPGFDRGEFLDRRHDAKRRIGPPRDLATREALERAVANGKPIDWDVIAPSRCRHEERALDGRCAACSRTDDGEES